MNSNQIKRIIEAAIMVSEHPVSLEQIMGLFSGEESININELKDIIQELSKEYEGHGIELREVASGYRFQAQADLAPWLSKLYEERAPRYSRALLETLALVAYRQPITRAEVEEVRGVAISSNIMKTLLEREWVRVIGHKDVPGKPAIYGTTKQFLDYFNLKSLEELPTLADIQNLEALGQALQLQLEVSESESSGQAVENSEGEALAELEE